MTGREVGPGRHSEVYGRDADGGRTADGPGRRPGKHPLGRLVPHGVREASADPATIRRWWGLAPRANIGLALGPGEHNTGGLFVVDVDVAKGGDRLLADLVRTHGPLGPTLHAFTGSGGDHYFLRHPAAARIVGAAHRLGRGLDVQAGGQYVVAAPSLHASGNVYAWEDEDAPALDAPAWLLEIVVRPSPAVDDAGARRLPPRAPFAGPRPVDVQRAVAYLASLPPAIEGQGGDRVTTRAAHQLVRGFRLSPDCALELLVEHYNPRCLPPWTREALARKVEYVDRTSQSVPGFLLRATP